MQFLLAIGNLLSVVCALRSFALSASISAPAGSAGTSDAVGRHAIGTLSLRLTFGSHDDAPSAVFQIRGFTAAPGPEGHKERTRFAGEVAREVARSAGAAMIG
jgi:hypothetical protein